MKADRRTRRHQNGAAGVRAFNRNFQVSFSHAAMHRLNMGVPLNVVSIQKRASAPKTAKSRGAQLRAKYGAQFGECSRFRGQSFTPAQSNYYCGHYMMNLAMCHISCMNSDARMFDPKAKESLRMRVARAVVDDGMSQAESMRTFHVGRTSVHNWTTAYREGGDAALRTKRMGRPKRSMLPGHQPVATNSTIFGEERNVLESPTDGIVLGMTTLPMVKPGEPVCHIALHRGLRTDLATNITLSEREADRAPDAM